MYFSRQVGCGFSLLEVVIAVGIFAGAISILLGLVPSLTRQAGTTADCLTATQLPDAIRLELHQVAEIGGFETLAGQCRPMVGPLPATLTLVADRSAQRVQSSDYLAPGSGERLAPEVSYFLIEIWRYHAPPMAIANDDQFLALLVRISWPYHIPGTTTATVPEHREQITFSLALNR